MSNLLLGLIRNGEPDALTSRLRAHLDANEVYKLTETDPIPSAEVLETYSFRSRMWEKRGARVEGASQLLYGLTKFEGRVVIHRFDYATESFIVFSDVRESRVIGILVAQRRESGKD